MNTFCVGCGKPLNPLSAACPECGTAAVGARFDEDASIRLRGTAQVPAVCCCCLNEHQVTKNAKAAMSFEVAMKDLGFRQKHLLVPLPWCRSCRNRSRILFAVNLLGFFLGSVAALFLIAWKFDVQEPGFLFIGSGLALGGLISWLAGALMALLLPRRPGHVRSCRAVGPATAAPMADGETYQLRLILRNRAFAKLWIAKQKKDEP